MSSSVFESNQLDFQSNARQQEGGTDWKIDYTWLGITLALVIFGVVMIYSASSQLAARKYHNSFYFAQKQACFAFLGFLAMIAFRFIPYQKFKRWAPWLLLGGIISLILVLIPGIGSRMGGASRWFRLAGISIQPAEFSKLIVVVFLAWSMARHQDLMKDLKNKEKLVF